MSSERSKLERKRLSERAEARQRRHSEEEESPRTGGRGVAPPCEELPGEVWYVPDTWWGFGLDVRESHPGACVAFDEQMRQATLLRGLTPTDKARRLSNGHVLVPASRENGLQHETMFPLQPWWFGEPRVRCLYPERRVGRLGQEDLERLQSELYRVFCVPNVNRGGGQ